MVAAGGASGFSERSATGHAEIVFRTNKVMTAGTGGAGTERVFIEDISANVIRSNLYDVFCTYVINCLTKNVIFRN